MLAELIVQNALREGKFVHVDEVENGLKCGCVCPVCNQRLIAKQGSLIAHHFSHGDGNWKKCAETLAHLLAKKYLSSIDNIIIPPIFTLPNDYKMLEDTSSYQIISVKVENKINEIRPDLILNSEHNPLAIEIKVTHGSREKIDKYAQMGISALEYHLDSNVLSEESIANLWFFLKMSG